MENVSWNSTSKYIYEKHLKNNKMKKLRKRTLILTQKMILSNTNIKKDSKIIQKTVKI